jgi:hypothetical protein
MVSVRPRKGSAQPVEAGPGIRPPDGERYEAAEVSPGKLSRLADSTERLSTQRLTAAGRRARGGPARCDV